MKNHKIQTLLLTSLSAIALVLTGASNVLSHSPIHPDSNNLNQESTPQKSHTQSSISDVERILSQIPQDTPVEFPAGTNYPVSTSGLTSDTSIPRTIYVIGFVDSSGKSRNFTPNTLTALFIEMQPENPLKSPLQRGT